MAFTSNAVNAVLEGLVGNTIMATGQLNEPQAMTVWLRAMKETVLYNGRMIEDDHVIESAVGIDGTTNGTTINAAASWVYGWIATSTDAQANVALLTNVATFNPGTTALDYHGVLYLPTAAAGTPATAAQIWFPHEYFDVGIYANGVYHSNFDTTAVASTMNCWTVRRNQ